MSTPDTDKPTGRHRIRPGRSTLSPQLLQSDVASKYLRELTGSQSSPNHPAEYLALQRLFEQCGVEAAGADQLLAYVAGGVQILGGVPTQTCVIAERFFDEAGGMQLVLHAPFGGRLNRAWGLALRKRFCVNFDFELQAAATDDGLVLSLGEQHSFPLDAIFQFLQPQTVRGHPT